MSSFILCFFFFFFFFFNDTATTEIYTLSLHDALPIAAPGTWSSHWSHWAMEPATTCRSEEHTSELQSQSNLVCRLLLEKKKTTERAESTSKEKTASRWEISTAADSTTSIFASRRACPTGCTAIAAMALFFFNHTATTEIYTLSLHDALPISLLISNEPQMNKHEPLGSSAIALTG